MKSPTNGPRDGRAKPEQTRPMSCRGSAMQREIAAAVRAASPDAPHTRQSWRVKAVIAGDQPSCPTLEMVIDERIAAGASEDDVMEIAHVIARHTRQKLMDARPGYAALVRDLDAAMKYETQLQGPQDVATVESFGRRCVNSLRQLLARTTQHRDAADLVIVAAQREIAERERGRAMEKSRLTIAGRAS
jgi:hypothetical protein